MKKTYLLAIILFLSCGALIFAKKIADLPHPTTAARPLVAHERLYFKERTTFYIYSMKDFSLEKKYGKEGEGPREFKRALYWTGIRGDTFVIQSVQRLSYFTKEGNYIKQINIRPRAPFFIPMGERFVSLGHASENGILYYSFKLYDANQERLKEVLRYKNHYQRNKSFNAILDLGDWPKYVIYDRKIFIVNQEKDSILEVFDYDGSKINTIGADLERITLTSKRAKKYDHYFKNLPGLKSYYEEHKRFIKYPRYFPKVRNFHIDNDKVYVLTYKREGPLAQFVIFDMSGKRLEEKMLPLKYRDELFLHQYTIADGKVYQLVENEETETWELHQFDFDN